MSGARRLTRLAAAGVVSAAGLALMARASSAPLPYHGDGTARLRLSWSARPERIEVCRALSAEELAEREEHMRQRVECNGRFATYTLQVEADGRVLGTAVVRGAGLRHDRPLYLLRDFAIEPGEHRVRVTFARREHTDGDSAAVAAVGRVDADTGIFAGRAQREMVERARRVRAAIPARLVLDTTLAFVPNRVTIVTFDPDRRTLTARDETTRPRDQNR